MADQIQLGSLGVPQAKTGRLAYIDWMRGLACIVMFQAHCYNSWLSPAAKKSGLYLWSQIAATLPAPLFIFLAGMSIALVTQRMRHKFQPRGLIAKKTISRGAEIFALGLLFRVQEFALGYRWSPWTDLLRVDVLNILGLSMMLMGVLCWVTDWRRPGAPSSNEELRRASRSAIFWGLGVAALVALATPLLWTTYRPSWLAWPLESYVNGVHIYNQPQPWLFPLFPWSAFGFVGLAVGFFLFYGLGRRREALAIAILGGAGAV